MRKPLALLGAAALILTIALMLWWRPGDFVVAIVPGMYTTIWVLVEFLIIAVLFLVALAVLVRFAERRWSRRT